MEGFDWTHLALFTTLTPAGAVAYAVVACILLVQREPGQPRDRLSHALFVPLAVCWAGFIASATHLGTPANALYTVTGIGRSPLSNEVASVVVFLFVAGVYWLYTFRRVRSMRVECVGLVLSVAAAAGLLYFTSQAYAIKTVGTWDTWYAPATLVVGALCAGASLAAGVAAHVDESFGAAARVALIVAAAACVAEVVLLLLYAGHLAGVGNNVVSAGEASSSYPVVIVAYVVLVIVGICCQVAALRRRLGSARTALCTGGCTMVLVGTFIARTAFYSSYLSVGF